MNSVQAQPTTGVTGWGGVGIGGVPIPSGLSNIIAMSAKGASIFLAADGTLPGIPGASNIVAIAAGYSHNLAVSNGIVFGWGDNAAGEINPPADLSNVVAVAAGVQDSLALTSDGTVVGWGYNRYGQVSIPSGLTGVVAIAAGYYHNLALAGDGTVTTWGYNGDGETNVPVGLNGVIAIAGGYYHSLALKTDGTVVGWGSNSKGQAQPPVGLSNIVAIAAGAEYSVALRNDGRVVTWGDNFYGQTNQPANLSNVVAVAGAYSYALALTNNGAPWVLRQPAGRAVYPGSDPTFAPVVLGSAPMMFQWRSNGVDVIAATNQTLVLTNVQPSAAAAYQLVISNTAGSVITSNAFLTVVPAPAISIQPQNLTTNGGAIVTFAVNVAEQGPLAFQWRFNGTNLPGATNSSLTLSNVLASQSGSYSVRIVDSFGVLISPTASLTVVPWVTASIQPNSVVAGSGTFAVFTIASGGFSTNTTYQWRKDGLSMGGFWLWASTSPAAYVSASMANAGTYDVVASDSSITATSSVVTLTVIPLVITAQPTNRGAWLGGPAKFAVTAVGQSPVSYQWQFNGANIPGATTNSLNLTNVQASQLGAYDVVVTNAYTNIMSRLATLSVSEVAAWGGIYGESNLTTGLTNMIAISAGVSAPTDCQALTRDGRVLAWPNNYGAYGNALPTNLIAVCGSGPGFGINSNDVLVEFPSEAGGLFPTFTNLVAISSYSSTVLGLRGDGTVLLLGSPSSLPAGISNLVAIAVGGGHYLGLKPDGTVIAWGNNSFGQATVPAGLSNVIAIAAGASHSLALRDDGTVAAWGQNVNGQTNLPSGLSNVVAIAAGGFHNLALRANGTVIAWGLNSLGQTNVPSTLTNVIAIAAGQYHSMALIGNGPPVTQASFVNPQVGSGVFKVSLPSQSGRIYVLEYKNSLSDNGWNGLQPVPGNGATVILSDPSAMNGKRFYRVRRW